MFVIMNSAQALKQMGQEKGFSDYKESRGNGHHFAQRPFQFFKLYCVNIALWD